MLSANRSDSTLHCGAAEKDKRKALGGADERSALGAKLFLSCSTLFALCFLRPLSLSQPLKWAFGGKRGGSSSCDVGGVASFTAHHSNGASRVAKCASGVSVRRKSSLHCSALSDLPPTNRRAAVRGNGVCQPLTTNGGAARRETDLRGARASASFRFGAGEPPVAQK
ncbi:hypothetical protein AOLI_G00309220 [Acnodon oligacanthus]